MKWRFFILFVLASILLSCKSASNYLEEAEQAMDKEQYEKAVSLLDKGLKKDKHLIPLYIQKAFCLVQLNQLDSAIHTLEFLLSFSTNTMALYNIGICKYEQGRYKESVDHFTRALKTKGIDPQDSTAQLTFEYSEFGKQITGRGKYDVTAKEIYYMMGLSCYELGQIRESYRYFKYCVSNSYNTAECHYMMGLCWLSSEKKDKACEFFELASFAGYELAKEQINKNCK